MSFSKHVARAACADAMHSWAESCGRAHRDIIRSSAVGSLKLFGPILLVELALKLYKKKKLDEDIVLDFIVDLFRSTTMGTCICTTFLGLVCFFRYVLGRFTPVSIAFMPGFLAGLTYLILRPTMRLQVYTTFGNAAIETILLKMSHSGWLTLNVYTETAWFMLMNACLMYASRSSKSGHSDYTWFFRPDRNVQKDDRKDFLKTILHKTRNYFGLGLGFGILRMLISDVTVLAPENCHKIFKTSTLKPGLFAGSYVAVYELTVYLLNRILGNDRPAFALPAGFMAGMTYAIDPNLSIVISVLINLIQILYKNANVRLLRRVSMDTIFFCLSAGTLFHVQLLHPKSISRVGAKFISVTSGNTSKKIFDGFHRLYHSGIL